MIWLQGYVEQWTGDPAPCTWSSTPISCNGSVSQTLYKKKDYRLYFTVPKRAFLISEDDSEDEFTLLFPLVPAAQGLQGLGIQ